MVVQYRAKISIAAMSFYLFAISACAQIENADKKTVGQGIGAVACGAAGAWVSRNISILTRGTITGASALSCGWLGGQIGAYLDEQDREKMNEAAQAALDTGEVQTWGGDDGEASGSAEIVRSAADAPVGRECQTVRNTIVLADGSEKQEDVTACKGTNGQWEVAEG